MTKSTSSSPDKVRVQQQFGANAAHYVKSATHATGASLQRVVELVRPQAHWRGIDIATGAGHMAHAFAPHVAHMTASDITPQMLEQAARGAAAKGLGNVDTAIADAEALPFADASFELVSCRIAPHHFPDIPRFIAEVARVLKSGGTFALVDNVSPDSATSPGFSAEACAAADVHYNLFEKIRDPSHGRALTVPAWRGLFTGSGLEVMHQEIMQKTMMYRAWCENMAVPPEVAYGIKAMLDAPSPCLGAFLAPRKVEGGELAFTLHELVLIAQKAG